MMTFALIVAFFGLLTILVESAIRSLQSEQDAEDAAARERWTS